MCAKAPVPLTACVAEAHSRITSAARHASKIATVSLRQRGMIIDLQNKIKKRVDFTYQPCPVLALTTQGHLGPVTGKRGMTWSSGNRCSATLRDCVLITHRYSDEPGPACLPEYSSVP
jgi:hypothetical protein